MTAMRTFEALIAVTVLVCLFGCQGGEQQPMSEATSKDMPVHESWGSTIILSTRGQNRAKVWAGHILKFEESRRIIMDENIKVDFFNDRGDHVSVLTAEGGEVDEASQDLQAIGQVVVLSDQGSRLETELLKWHHATQKIISDTLVTITDGDERVSGMKFESNADLTHWEIKESVTGIVKVRGTGEK